MMERWLREFVSWLVDSAAVVGKLTARFKLSNIGSGRLYLSSLIVPVTNVDEALVEYKILAGAADISAGGVYVLVVGEHERVTILEIGRGGTAGASAVTIVDASGNGHSTVQATTLAIQEVRMISMDSGWSVLLTQGAVGDAAVGYSLYYALEQVS